MKNAKFNLRLSSSGRLFALRKLFDTRIQRVRAVVESMRENLIPSRSSFQGSQLSQIGRVSHSDATIMLKRVLYTRTVQNNLAMLEVTKFPRC